MVYKFPVNISLNNQETDQFNENLKILGLSQQIEAVMENYASIELKVDKNLTRSEIIKVKNKLQTELQEHINNSFQDSDHVFTVAVKEPVKE